LAPRPAETHCQARAGTRWRSLVGAPGVACGHDGVVAGHRQHISDAAGLQPGPQRGVGAVDLIAGHPAGWHARVQRAAEHGRGQGRLGRKPHLIGDTGSLAAVRVTGPTPGDIQLPVDHAVPSRAGIHKQDRDLRALHAARGAGVLALHPHGLGALLPIAGLVHHQHPVRVAQVLDQVGADVVTHPVVVPHRPGQQVLHPIRGGIPGVLGQRPAVLTGQIR
jgi:hypothetical protein